MSRPTTKKELMEAANTNYYKLLQLINSMSNDIQRKEFQFDETTLGKEAHWKRDKNIRDVLVHLYEWHQLLINWIQDNQSGNTKPFLPNPYNWKTYGDMNVEFFKKHQNTPYEKAKQMFEESHNEVVKLIETFTNKQLFEKGIYPWTGTTTLGSYCVSATSSHYDWATKKIKKHIKSQEN